MFERGCNLQISNKTTWSQKHPVTEVAKLCQVNSRDKKVVCHILPPPLGEKGR